MVDQGTFNIPSGLERERERERERETERQRDRETERERTVLEGAPSS